MKGLRDSGDEPESGGGGLTWKTMKGWGASCRLEKGKEEDKAEEGGEAKSLTDTCGSSRTCGCVKEKG